MFQYVYSLSALCGPFLAAYVLDRKLADVVPRDGISQTAKIIAFLGICIAVAFLMRDSPKILTFQTNAPAGVWSLRPYLGPLGFGAAFAMAGFPYFVSAVTGPPRPPQMVRRIGFALSLLAWVVMAFSAWVLYHQNQ